MATGGARRDRSAFQVTEGTDVERRRARRRLVGATICVIVSVGLSTFASLAGLGLGARAWSTRWFGVPITVAMNRWQPQSFRTEIAALATALLVTGLWLLWNAPAVPRWLRAGFLVAALCVIFAFVSAQIARDVLGIT